MRINHTDFFQKHPQLFEILASVANLYKVNIGRQMNDRDKPNINASCSNGREGFYFRVRQYAYLTDDQYQTIHDMFPLSIKGYTLVLFGVSDFDHDDDRYWEPSVSFGIYKNGINVLDSTELKKNLHWTEKKMIWTE
tara:strand:- start:566 stop:976 length:411 start_codon:yes stop_codon:yes gene_type:complete